MGGRGGTPNGYGVLGGWRAKAMKMFLKLIEVMVWELYLNKAVFIISIRKKHYIRNGKALLENCDISKRKVIKFTNVVSYVERDLMN